MDIEKARESLEKLKAETAGLPRSVSAPEFTSWRSRTRSALTKNLGANHHITQSFIGIKWTASAYALSNAAAAHARAFDGARGRAQGFLDAAISELDTIAEDDPVADEGIDQELWQHIAAEVSAGQWGKVASQTAIFTEDRIRRWAGQPPERVGQDLMTAVFGENGDYRLGLTSGEKQGWHRFAMGVSMALRNADAHRISKRPDHKLYALGVVGASSLLLTQMRFEHGNRFQDTSDVPKEEPDEAEQPAEG